MTPERRRCTVDEVAKLVVLYPPLGHWWLLIADSHEATRLVAGALATSASRTPALPCHHMHCGPDADLFLRTLARHPDHALIFTAHPGPSPDFWRRLDKARPRLRRQAPTVLVLTEAAAIELRACASHLSGWLSTQSLYVHDVAQTAGDARQVALYDKLACLLPPQFEEVVLRLALPTHHLPSAYAPLSDRALAVIRLLEQQERLDALDTLLAELSFHLR